MKKAIALLLVVVLTAAAAIGGTLAFLTDRENETNVFTMGDVKIELDNQFAQGIELAPGVAVDNTITITNTGANDAWVWYTVKFEQCDADAIEVTGIGAEWTQYNGANLLNAYLPVGGSVTVDMQIELDKKVDIAPNGDLYLVDNGATTKLNWNISVGNPVAYINAYAIQTDTFATVEAAYDGYIAQWGGLNGEKAEAPTIARVDTAEALVDALSVYDVIILDRDITADGTSITVPAGKDVTLNLNGKTLTNPVIGAPALINNGTLTITGNGAIVNGTSDTAKSHTVRNYGNITIQNGSFGTFATSGAAFVNDGTAVINGGEFASRQESNEQYGQGPAAYAIINNSGTTIINDATINGPTHGLFGAYAGDLIVNGGNYTLVGNNGMGCYVVYATGANTKVVLNGGTINTNEPRHGRVFFVYDNGNYFNADAVATGKIVIGGADISLNGAAQSYNTAVSTVAGLAAALEAGESVTLTEDVDLTETQINIPAGKAVTLNLNGNDIVATQNGTTTYGAFNIPAGATLNVVGEGDVTVKTNVTSGISASIFQNDGTLNIYGGNYEINQATSVAGLQALIAVIDNCPYDSEAVVNIYDGTFAVTGLGASNVIRNWPIHADGKATLNVYGGTFKANPERTTTYLWNKDDSTPTTLNSFMNFYGGTFEAGVVYEDYNGQDDIYIAPGVVIEAYSGNN